MVRQTTLGYHSTLMASSSSVLRPISTKQDGEDGTDESYTECRQEVTFEETTSDGTREKTSTQTHVWIYKQVERPVNKNRGVRTSTGCFVPNELQSLAENPQCQQLGFTPSKSNESELLDAGRTDNPFYKHRRERQLPTRFKCGILSSCMLLCGVGFEECIHWTKHVTEDDQLTGLVYPENANLICRIWFMIQDQIGPARLWPTSLRKLMWQKHISYWDRIMIAVFAWVNGLHPGLLFQWMKFRGCLRNQDERHRHLKSVSSFLSHYM